MSEDNKENAATHEPRPAGDLREAFSWPEPKFVPIESGAKLNPERVAAAFRLINGEMVIGEQFKLVEMILDGTEYTVATHSPAPMAGEGEARLILRALRTRMATACDWTRAGNDHVKVRTADWHVLMEIGERAKDYLAAHPSTQEGGE